MTSNKCVIFRGCRDAVFYIIDPWPINSLWRLVKPKIGPWSQTFGSKKTQCFL